MKSEIILASAKERIGFDEILSAIVERIPHPKGDPNAPLQALVFDSVFDSYRGAIAYVRIVNGVLKVKDQIKFFTTGNVHLAEEIGVLGLQKAKTR